jgi:hypothetical protein
MTQHLQHDLLLEVKKEVTEVVAFRNRGIATTSVAEGSDPVLAKNGIKVAKGVDANRFILEHFLGRYHDKRIKRKDLISLRDQMEKGADLVALHRCPRVNFEPDMKRRLVSATMVTICHGEFAGTEHLATTSESFDTVQEALAERAVFEAWRHGQKGVLKTMADWNSWRDYLDSIQARKRAGANTRITKGGSAEVLKRQFLRALVRGLWGVTLGERTHDAVAHWLSESGHPTTVSDVKNATRPNAVPVEGAVAASAAAFDLLRALTAEFPTLDVARVFGPADAEAALAFLAGGPQR